MPHFECLCRFPATFTFVLRAFSTLEGIGRALDPNYKFVAVAQPYAQQLLDLQVGHCVVSVKNYIQTTCRASREVAVRQHGGLGAASLHAAFVLNNLQSLLVIL